MSDIIERAPDYELVKREYDMTVHLHRHGLRIASVTMKEIFEHRLRGDTPEMSFARALAYRRTGQEAIVDHTA